VLVVDDEPLARGRLLRMLAALEGVEPAGEAASGREALDKIAELAPDCVLLDVRMPGLDGLEVARASDVPVIFVTAHDAYAVEAFELCAVDYLLKPVRRERLARALARVRERRGARADSARLDALFQRLLAGAGEPGESPARLRARRGDALHLFDPREIARFTAAGGYSSFRSGGHEFLLDESLSQLEERLAPLGFLRVHRAELVRLDAVRALHGEHGSLELELAGGERVPVSRRLAGELRRRLGLR
jgi:two-component system LytT family response regulator